MKCLRSCFAVPLIILAMQVPSARSADLLAVLNGNWTGTGWAKQTTDGLRETVRCRISSNYTRPDRQLVVTGKCAVPGRKFNLKGMVSSRIEGGAITGRWSNPFGAGSASVAGRQTENNVFLDFRAPHPDTKKKVPQQMEWKIANNNFTITTRLRDGPVMSELTFAR